MPLKINFQRDKREDENARPFIDFYLSKFFPTVSEVAPSNPDAVHQQKMPDYFIEELGIVIEVKEVHDFSYVVTSAAWSKSANLLREKINQKGSSFLDGIYLIDAPQNLRVRASDVEKLADRFLEAIRQKAERVDIAGFGSFEISRYEGEGKVVFASSSGVQSVDPPATVNANISNKIATANKQLGAYAAVAKRKILLLVNRYVFASEVGTFIDALSRDYEKLLKYKNIDEVWLQIQPQSGGAVHELLYNRTFLEKFHSGNFDFDAQEIASFEQWFLYLQKLGDPYKDKLFAALRTLLQSKAPHELFADAYIRSEMADLGSWLIEQKRFSDTLWIVEKFIDDPDPPEPGSAVTDKRFDYHQEIVDGGDPLVITTALGRLAWVIQRLALQQEYIGAAFGYTKKLLEHKNLYVKLQGLIPLTEVAARRMWLDGWKERPLRGQYKDFHDVVFSLVEMMRVNPTYTAIANALARIFAYYKDITTSEAESVLESLKITDEAAPLFVYFGLFRERHYKELAVPFDGALLKKKLDDVVMGKVDVAPHLRGSIAWHFWKLLETNPEEFDAIKPYIDLFLEQPYDHDVYPDIEFIIRDWIDRKPEICTAWLETFLDRVLSDPQTKSREGVLRSLWLMDMESITARVGAYDPQALITVMGKLVELWERGMFVGDLNRLFANFKAVSDEDQQRAVKIKFQEFYRSMRALDQKLGELSWD